MCLLRVTGRDLDPDKVLASSEHLAPDKVFRRGEPRSFSQPEGRQHAISGFTVEVSRSSRSDLVGQVRDAVAFLKEHEVALARLHSEHGVEDMRLDFPVDLRIDRESVFTQFEYFPPELVSLAGALGLGLEISIYPLDLEELARRRAERSQRRKRESE